MLTVDAARALVLETVQPGPVESRSFERARNATLRESIAAGIDSPPFDKSLMDGFAARSEDLARGYARLRLLERVMAGMVPQREVVPGTAIQIMTGAPIPAGADVVVRVEDSTLSPDGEWVELRTKPLSPGTNILRRGTSMRADDVVLTAGAVLHAPQLALLAEIGRTEVPVTRATRVAILSTGDELVPVATTPGPGQIRNSNAPMLHALVEQNAGQVVPLGIAVDRLDALTERVRAGLEADFLLLSGGVSAGELDLVPKVLRDCGVEEIFHKVQMKPGKPLWFGIRRRADREATYVFGLPGNPVSSLVGFELFVVPAMRRFQGQKVCLTPPITARLTQPHLARGDRPTYHPALLEWFPEGPGVTPAPWRGSADLRGTAGANCLIHFPAGDVDYPAGAVLPTFRFSPD